MDGPSREMPRICGDFPRRCAWVRRHMNIQIETFSTNEFRLSYMFRQSLAESIFFLDQNDIQQFLFLDELGWIHCRKQTKCANFT